MTSRRRQLLLCLPLLWGMVGSRDCGAAEPARAAPTPAAPNQEAVEGETPAERGFRLVTTKPYVPADFPEAVFEDLWTVWPEPLKQQAADASPAERRRLAFERYGLMERPGSEGAGPPLGYTSDGKGGWAMNCLACHTGSVEGKVVLGAGNSLFNLETLTDDIRLAKQARGLAPRHMEFGRSRMPLGTTRGTTNAVMFGVALWGLRDLELNPRLNLRLPSFVHHDMDAPAFWNVSRKRLLYCEGSAEKGPRPLLQFTLVPQNSGEKIKSWEGEFADILAWIESLQPPPYTGSIDGSLATVGKQVFEANCVRCHGPQGPGTKSPEKMIPLAEIGTDPVRLHSLSDDFRQSMHKSWFGDYGKHEYNLEPTGYVAPPLNGIWASAPYFHNGSVPTLWHLLHPEQRPVVWRRTLYGYDHPKLGLEVEVFEELPAGVQRADERREYFDTRKKGKSAEGHLFVNELTEDEKRAVLEYLKTL
jgi:mono/diheme cytochrome c family protein